MDSSSKQGEEYKYKWYALKVKSGSESYSLKETARKIVREKKSLLFERILFPAKALLSVKRNKKRLISKSFFPGYVFIKMIACEESLSLFRGIPGVLKFVGEDIPGEISEETIKNLIKKSYSSSLIPERVVSFNINESIRIKKGPFLDQDAIIDDVDYAKSKINVSMPVFGRLVKIELGFDEVEKN